MKWLDMSSTPVILHVGLNDQSWRKQLKKRRQETKKTEDNHCLSEVKCKIDGPVASHDYAHIHMSIIYVSTRVAKTTHQQVLSIRKKPATFFSRLYFCAHKNFAYSSSAVKVSIPV